MKRLLAAAVVVLGVLIWFVFQRGTAAKEAPFARVARETVVSAVTTNGKVEPLDWISVTAERAGVVEKVRAERGQRAGRGDVLVEVDAAAARTELSAAEARVSQVKAELSMLASGGRASTLAELDGELARARIELEEARKEKSVQDRLLARQASTRQESEGAATRLSLAEALVQSLEKRRSSLAGAADMAAAEARLREAEAGLESARLSFERAVLRSPIAGIVYDLTLRPGAYLNPGDLVARVGRIDKVRVRVYVDEPELGRVGRGMPVTITWDGLAGRRWQGEVESLPAEITTLGTRQVGEVTCVIENPSGELLPGANVNAEIRSQAAENALSIPREALRREAGEAGVLVLQGDTVAWRKIKTGVSSVTRVQVVEGLSEGDSVALPGQRPLAPGDKIRAVWR